MMLNALLARKQAAIWETWRQLVFSGYPERGGQFFSRSGDRFSNPVGHAISEGTRTVLAALIDGSLESNADVQLHLERMIKIRAIQDFTPSESVSFVYGLRDALRQHLEPEIAANPSLSEQLRTLEDGPLGWLLLRAFDIYADCREKLYDVRVSELKRSVHSLIRRFRDPELPLERDTGEPGAERPPDLAIQDKEPQ